ncbi:hypothetical protein Tco_0211411 [Tanacetum coccineum]
MRSRQEKKVGGCEVYGERHPTPSYIDTTPILSSIKVSCIILKPNNGKGYAILKKECVNERLIEKIDISFALTIDVHMTLSRQKWMIGNSKTSARSRREEELRTKIEWYYKLLPAVPDISGGRQIDWGRSDDIWTAGSSC